MAKNTTTNATATLDQILAELRAQQEATAKKVNKALANAAKQGIIDVDTVETLAQRSATLDSIIASDEEAVARRREFMKDKAWVGVQKAGSIYRKASESQPTDMTIETADGPIKVTKVLTSAVELRVRVTSIEDGILPEDCNGYLTMRLIESRVYMNGNAVVKRTHSNFDPEALAGFNTSLNVLMRKNVRRWVNPNSGEVRFYADAVGLGKAKTEDQQ